MVCGKGCAYSQMESAIQQKMIYTLIPSEHWIDENRVEVSSDEELNAEVERFCASTGADMFKLDCVSEEDELREYEMDKELDWMR